jgi:hypothetical protein
MTNLEYFINTEKHQSFEKQIDPDIEDDILQMKKLFREYFFPLKLYAVV